MIFNPAVDKDPYPCVVIKSRYGGTYEGSSWLAFYCDKDQIPNEAFGSDVPCGAWHSLNGHLLGHGDSPSAAVANLAEKIEAGEVPDPWGYTVEDDKSECICCHRPLTKTATDILLSNNLIDPEVCRVRDPDHPERRLPHLKGRKNIPWKGFTPVPAQSSENWGMYNNNGSRKKYSELSAWDQYFQEEGPDGYPVEIPYETQEKRWAKETAERHIAEDARDRAILAGEIPNTEPGF